MDIGKPVKHIELEPVPLEVPAEPVVAPAPQKQDA